MRKAINYLLTSLAIHPVLLDIGASGSPPAIWEKISSHSIYIGFDPDERATYNVNGTPFFKANIIDKAVTADKENNEVRFYLTTSPSCSSTLKPDQKSLSNYLFSNLFTVEKLIEVKAIQLDEVLDRLTLSGIDWFKTDSQGTDLRLFNSLNPVVRSRVLAIDIEPGLMDAYIGEDLFVNAHRELNQNGFWLSNLNVCGAIRMRRSTLKTMTNYTEEFNDDFVSKAMRTSPFWCEARYLRTIEWLAQGVFSKREYILLWVFALLDGQFGYAVDLGIEYEKFFGKDDISSVLLEEPIRLMRRSRQIMQFKAVMSIPLRIIRRFIRSLK